MRRTIRWFATAATVIAVTACGGASGPGPFPTDGGGVGHDGGVRFDASHDGGGFPDAAHLDAGHADAPPLFDASL